MCLCRPGTRLTEQDAWSDSLTSAANTNGEDCLTTRFRNTEAARRPLIDRRESDQLILVDDADSEVGQLGKADCHAGAGVLHRALSLFVFNSRNEFLLQQRSEHKRLWPNYWSNSCCSHPRAGESTTTAVHRRLMEELGLACPLKFLFKFKYQAQYDATGSEHELCSVFFGRSTTPVHPNRDEIAEWRW